MKKLQTTLSAGFTLVEVMVSSGIVLLLAFIAYPNVLSFEERKSLTYSAELASSTYRDVRASVLSGKKLTQNSDPRNGYGVKIFHGEGVSDNNIMLVYEDIDGDKQFTPYSQEELRRIFLPNGVYFSKVRVRDSSNEALFISLGDGLGDIYFASPLANIFVNGSDATRLRTVSIVLAHPRLVERMEVVFNMVSEEISFERYEQ